MIRIITDSAADFSAGELREHNLTAVCVVSNAGITFKRLVPAVTKILPYKTYVI